MKAAALIVSCLVLAQPLGAAEADSAPQLARVTTIRSFGSASLTAILGSTSVVRFAKHGGETARFSTEGGRFAGVLVQQLRADQANGIGNQFLLLRLFPPLGCAQTRCASYEYQWRSDFVSEDEPPSLSQIELPAGTYRITLIADGGSPTAVELRFPSSEGTTELLADEPTHVQAAVVGEPTTVASFQPTVQGAANGTMEGYGLAYLFTWAVLGPGAVSVFNHCYGDPDDRSTFDERGNCQPNMGMGFASGGGGATHTYSVSIRCFSTPCSQRTLRIGFRWTHPPGHNQGAGAVLLWAPYA